MDVYIVKCMWSDPDNGESHRDYVHAILDAGNAFSSLERAMKAVQEYYDEDRCYVHELESIDEEVNPEVNFPEHTWEFEKVEGTKYWSTKMGPMTDYGHFYARITRLEVGD